MELRWLGLLILSIYLFLILGSYSRMDDSYLIDSGNHVIHNFGGRLGAFVSDLLFFLGGYSAYVLLVLTLYLLWRAKKQVVCLELGLPIEPLPRLALWIRPVGFILFWLGLMGLESLSIFSDHNLPEGKGGILGQAVADMFTGVIGLSGGVLLLLLMAVGGLSISLDFSWASVAEQVGYGLERFWARLLQSGGAYVDRQAGKKVAEKRGSILQKRRRKTDEQKPIRIEPVTLKVEPSERVAKEKQQPLFKELSDDDLPPLSLLDDAPEVLETISEDTLESPCFLAREP